MMFAIGEKLILFLKGFKAQSGYYLMGDPPRWHKWDKNNKAPKAAHHVVDHTAHSKAVEALQKIHHSTHAKSAAEMVGEVVIMGKKLADERNALRRLGEVKRDLLAGKKPSAGAVEWFWQAPKEKRDAAIAEVLRSRKPESVRLVDDMIQHAPAGAMDAADGQVSLFGDDPVVAAGAGGDAGHAEGDKWVQPLDAAIQEHQELVQVAATPTKADDKVETEQQKVELGRMEAARAEGGQQPAPAVGAEPRIVFPVAAATKPLDHGELNIPGRTKNINAELDKYKADQAKQQKAKEKSNREQNKADKARANELYGKYGKEMVAKYGAKLGEENLRKMFDQQLKWEPKKFIQAAESYEKEMAKIADAGQQVASAQPPDLPPLLAAPNAQLALRSGYDEWKEAVNSEVEKHNASVAAKESRRLELEKFLQDHPDEMRSIRPFEPKISAGPEVKRAFEEWKPLASDSIRGLNAQRAKASPHTWAAYRKKAKEAGIPISDHDTDATLSNEVARLKAEGAKKIAESLAAGKKVAFAVETPAAEPQPLSVRNLAPKPAPPTPPVPTPLPAAVSGSDSHGATPGDEAAKNRRDWVEARRRGDGRSASALERLMTPADIREAKALEHFLRPGVGGVPWSSDDGSQRRVYFNDVFTTDKENPRRNNLVSGYYDVLAAPDSPGKWVLTKVSTNRDGDMAATPGDLRKEVNVRIGRAVSAQQAELDRAWGESAPIKPVAPSEPKMTQEELEAQYLRSRYEDWQYRNIASGGTLRMPEEFKPLRDADRAAAGSSPAPAPASVPAPAPAPVSAVAPPPAPAIPDPDKTARAIPGSVGARTLNSALQFSRVLPDYQRDAYLKNVARAFPEFLNPDGSRKQVATPSAAPVAAPAAPANRASVGKTYLSVPYERKDDAKRLGARWDAVARKWYFPGGVMPEGLRRFMGKAMPMIVFMRAGA